MHFPAPTAATFEPLGDAEAEEAVGAARAQPSSTVEITLAPSALAQAVLPRVLSALAARAHFSTDRISDVQLVADTLVASAEEAINGSQLVVLVNLAPQPGAFGTRVMPNPSTQPRA